MLSINSKGDLLTKKSITRKIYNNQNIFSSLLKLSENEHSEKRRIELLKFSSKWACTEHTGRFSSLELETMLHDIAQKHPVKNKKVQTNSYLHVMTSSYSIGGHTPLANQWIKQSNENEKHSLVLLNQIVDIPSWLLKSISEKNGDVFQFDYQQDDLTRAMLLRDIAIEYDYIILHVDMHDIIPALAFSHTEFSRPIVFVNHADHTFSLGLSYSDIISDLSVDGANFTQTKRGKVNSSIVTIPIKIDSHPLKTRVEALSELNLTLEKDQKVLLSMASAYKFHFFENYPFIDMALTLLESNPNLLIFVIGPDKQQDKKWQEAYQKSNGKLNAIGYKEHDEVLLYKSITDIYIDSFPFISYTSFLEFAAKGIPSLSLKTELNALDILKDTPNFCNDTHQLISVIQNIINNDDTSIYDLSQKVMLSYAPNELWKKKKYELLSSIPKQHSLHWDFSHKSNVDTYDIELYLIGQGRSPKALFFKKIDPVNNLKIMLIFLKFKHLNYITLLPYFFKIIKTIFKRVK